MNHEQFFDAVHKMRASQKEYFNTRSYRALRQSKAIEKEVDQYIMNHLIERIDNIENQTSHD